MTLLILAGTINQIPFIRTAQQLGIRVITTDNRADNPGHKLADKSYLIDTTNSEGVLTIAKSEAVDGIIGPCSDVSTATVAMVASQLGLNGPPITGVHIACDKGNFRKAMREWGLPSPEYHIVDSANIDFPGKHRWIVKPLQASGSRGIKVVENNTELHEAISNALSAGLSRAAIVEEFLDGDQFTCEAWLENGNISWFTILDRQTVELPYTATCGHVLPSRITPAVRQCVHNYLNRACNHLGFTNGPLDCDFVYANGEVYLLELAPRLGGNAISQLIATAYGIDLISRSIKMACKLEQPSIKEETFQPAAVIILGSKSNRAEISFHDLSASLAGLPWIEELRWDDDTIHKPIPAFTDGRSRLGQVIVRGNSRDEVLAHFDDVIKTLGMAPRRPYRE